MLARLVRTAAAQAAPIRLVQSRACAGPPPPFPFPFPHVHHSLPSLSLPQAAVGLWIGPLRVRAKIHALADQPFSSPPRPPPALFVPFRFSAFSPPQQTQAPRRLLSIHEHVSFGLLKQYDVAIPKGEVAYSPLDAEAIAQDLGARTPPAAAPDRCAHANTAPLRGRGDDSRAGEDIVIKAQVLAGGRGKGHFDNGLKGGVRVVYSYVSCQGPAQSRGPGGGEDKARAVACPTSVLFIVLVHQPRRPWSSSPTSVVVIRAFLSKPRSPLACPRSRVPTPTRLFSSRSHLVSHLGGFAFQANGGAHVLGEDDRPQADHEADRRLWSPLQRGAFPDLGGHRIERAAPDPVGACRTLQVYVCERLYARREFYFAILMDRKTQVRRMPHADHRLGAGFFSSSFAGGALVRGSGSGPRPGGVGPRRHGH